MTYDKEDLKTDISWITDGYATNKESKRFIIYLLEQNLNKQQIAGLRRVKE